MIGMEETFEEHLRNLLAVFHEVRRVLRPDGTLWLNYGDAYANDGKWGGSTGGKHARALHGQTGIGRRKVRTGLKPKDLILMPARLAMALQADGWWLRSEIVWHKPNAMPESVSDRPGCAHEKVFLLSRSKRYFYDAHAVRTPPSEKWEDTIMARKRRASTSHKSMPTAERAGIRPRGHVREQEGLARRWDRMTKEEQTAYGSHLRNVWSIATVPYRGAHFATFPPALAELCIRAGTSEGGCCMSCGAPRQRVVAAPRIPDSLRNREVKMAYHARNLGGGQAIQNWREENPPRTTGFRPTCDCGGPSGPCIVLDPFAGTGTTGVVASSLGRDAVLVEISEEYAAIASHRTSEV